MVPTVLATTARRRCASFCGAVGVAILSTAAVSGGTPIDGYRTAFAAAIAVALLGMLAAAVLLGRTRAPAAHAEPAIA